MTTEQENKIANFSFNFSDLDIDEVTRLNELLAEHGKSLRGCGFLFEQIFPSRRKALGERIDEITGLAQMPDSKSTKEALHLAHVATVMGGKKGIDALNRLYHNPDDGMNEEDIQQPPTIDDRYKMLRLSSLATVYLNGGKIEITTGSQKRDEGLINRT